MIIAGSVDQELLTPVIFAYNDLIFVELGLT